MLWEIWKIHLFFAVQYVLDKRKMQIEIPLESPWKIHQHSAGDHRIITPFTTWYKLPQNTPSAVSRITFKIFCFFFPENYIRTISLAI